MKKTILTLITLAAILASGNALAAPTGDIYDIAPTDMFGSEIAKSKVPLYSADKSMITGEKAYFKLRMLARENTAERWNMVYTGFSSSEFYPFQLGIFVSGKLTYATYVGKLDYGGLITDFIFEYETQAGDFALPIVLAVKSSSGPVPASDERALNTGSYYVNPLRTDWQARFNMSDGSYVTADWFVMGSAPFPIGTTIERHNDYSLAHSGFYVKTLDFSSNWQTNNVVWRSVHENSTNCDQTPQLVAKPATEKAVTLYVWSTNEESVVVYGSNVRTVEMPDPANVALKKTYHVGEITFAKGEASQNFSLKGVSRTANNGWAGLVLSAYDHFHVSDASGDLIVDFLSVPVRCIDPLPPSVIIEAEEATAKATSDYKTAANRLTIRLSEPSSTQFKVKVTPKFTDGHTGNWGDYVRFSKTDQTVTTLPDAVIPEVTLGAGIEEATLYVFCLRSDAHTTGVNQLKVVTSLSSGTPTPLIESYGEAGFGISAQNPEIVVPYEGQTLDGTIIAGDPLQLTMKIADTYADMASSAGYEVWVKLNVSDPGSFTKLSGMYKPGDGGILYRLNDDGSLSSERPTLTYLKPIKNTTEIYVKAPVSGKTSIDEVSGDGRKFYANVQAARSMELLTTGGTTYSEGSMVTFEIKLSAANDTGAKLYAFLQPDVTDASIFGGSPFIIGMTNIFGQCKGIEIKENKDTVKGSVQLLDGWNTNTTMAAVNFDVVLATEQDYAVATNKNKIYKGYGSASLELTIVNQEPVVNYVELNGVRSSYSGYKFPIQLPKGQSQRLKANVYDVPYDLNHATKPFKCKWTTYVGGIIQETKEISGNPNTNEFVCTFPKKGEWCIVLEVQDKDMDGGPNPWTKPYTNFVEVLDNPGILVVPSTEYPKEDATKESVSVGLSYNDADIDLTVRLEVVPAKSGALDKTGELVLDSNFRSTVPGEENIYYLTFPAGSTDAQSILIERMDGTLNSYNYGFYVKASVANTEVNPKTGDRWCDYYAPNNSTKIYPENVNPNDNDARENTFYPSVDTNGFNTVRALTWRVYRDVEQDWANGIKITITGGGGETYNQDGFVNGVKTVYEATSGTFTPVFKEQGDKQPVTITIADKDEGELTRTWYYNVAPSKYLTVIAHGPVAGTTTSELSQRYEGASGIGEGHVWVLDATFIEASSFRLYWNCLTYASRTLYAWGYKLANPIDNGSLNNNRDIAIAKNGAAKADVAVTDPYVYADEQGRDSFFYTWIKTTTDAESGETTTALMGSISPERPIKGDSSGSVELAKEANEDGNYPDTVVEAVFAKEYLPSDNMGDINFDRIPDLYYQKYKFTTTVSTGTTSSSDGSQTTSTEEVSASDLDSLSGYNEDNDFLPATLTAAAGSYAPGLAGSWVTAGLPFTADLEIRGYGDALNDAPALAGVTGVQPDRWYTDPDLDDTKSITNKSTLTKVEFLAWQEYAVAHGLDPDLNANWSKWSPERPTDPTLEDTDADGFPDGYEYFFWYRAHVGWLDIKSVGSVLITNHCYQTGRRFNPRNPGEGVLITAEEIETLMDPLTKAADGASADTRDTDNDGLPDKIELALGTNPFDFDSDGDAMAWSVVYFTVVAEEDKEYLCPELTLRKSQALPLDDLQYWQTFALKDPSGDANGVQWYAVRGDVEIEAEAVSKDVEVTTFRYYSGAGQLEDASSWRDAATTGTIMTSDGRLVANLDSADTFEYEASVDGDATNVVRGLPLTIVKGTFVSIGTTYPNFYERQLRTELKAKDCNAAWNYGTYKYWTDKTTSQQVLAIARHQAISTNKTQVVLAKVSNTRPVALMHHFVYQEYGFDPRTAWNPTGVPGSRWATTVGDEVNTDSGKSGVGFASITARTKSYTAYDEFMLMSFFLNNGVIGDTQVSPSSALSWNDIYQRYTTNPNGPTSTVTVVEGPFGTNGADTDNDGVPDGWELYVMAGAKNKDGLFVMASPSAVMGPLNTSFNGTTDDAGRPTMTDTQFDKDNLSELEEFRGTDSCGYYSDANNNTQTGCSVAYSTSVKLPDGWKWFNKFFPTDPWNKDTDGDGLSDSAEGGAFVNEGVADNGSTCIPGGGLNPCSVDTDLDGLPDGWEEQFKGSKLYAGINGTNDTVSASVSNTVGYIDGMDGTVFDAYTRPNDPVNRDYDHDGLENWQEYLVGAMRCWRYDDPVSPWYGIPYDTYAYTNGFMDLEATAQKLFDAQKLDAPDVNEFLYKSLFCPTNALYNPQFITDQTSGALYFSRVTNAWDIAYRVPNKGTGAAYYIFKDRVGQFGYDKIWAPIMGLGEESSCAKAPQKYISCDPTRADTDADGMDDYYELFHGLNPLLGKSGCLVASGSPCDVVYDAWLKDTIISPISALDNFWRNYVDEYDFVKCPFLNGLADADPDGDDIRNQVESLMPMVATDTWLHTDPSPLWMTDSSYTNSLVSQYWKMPANYVGVDFSKLPSAIVEYAGTTNRLSQCDGYYYELVTGGLAIQEKRYLCTFSPDHWLLGGNNWMFSFEQNEGYDSDHDGLGDYEEKEAKFHPGSSDPQDANSPVRRQAMYFGGEANRSLLQSMPQIAEEYPVGDMSYPTDPSFLQYTVECWVYPEKQNGAFKDATIVERVIWSDRAALSGGVPEYMRRNFLLGIKNGYWYTKFDSNGTLADGSVELMSSAKVQEGKWTHLAATYNGSQLIFYIDGVPEVSVNSSLQPEYGISALSVNATPGGTMAYWGQTSYSLYAIVVGASAKGCAQGYNDGWHLNVTYARGLSCYNNFFKGYIDEIRIWDGARTATEIQAGKAARMTAELAKSNQKSFYDCWRQGQRRYNKDGNGQSYVVPAELRYCYSFDSVPGADNVQSVAKVPQGFYAASGNAAVNRPADYTIAWWQGVLSRYGSVYSDPRWVTWVPNLVAHLPRYDGTTLDSVYWSEDFRGSIDGNFKFARTAEPVSYWTQMRRSGAKTSANYKSTSSRLYFVNNETVGNFNTLYEFTGRHLNQVGDDLLPLGGAFAKYCDATVGFWDDQGASSSWEITGSDTDYNGLPDWWEEMAKADYAPESSTLSWTTILKNYKKEGLQVTAGEAYLTDLARGYYADSTGKATKDAKYMQTADANGAGVPDWWMDKYGILGESALDDHDHDGLSNYTEYLLSEVFKFKGIRFSPIKANSVDPYTPDYFYKVGELYVGEIFTDHDRVDDLWEDLYPTLSDGITEYASRLKYDAHSDADEDGWSNRSEARYAKQSLPIAANQQYHYVAVGTTTARISDYPIPTLALTLRYNGTRQSAVNNASIVVQATTDYTMAGEFDAVWNIGSKNSTTNGAVRDLGKWSDRHAIGTLTPGNIVSSSLKLMYTEDPSAVMCTYEIQKWKKVTDKTEWSGAFGGWWSSYYGYGYAWVVETKRAAESEYEADKQKYGSSVTLLDRGDSYREVNGLTVSTDASGNTAVWKSTALGKTLGTVDLNTGAFDLDFGVFAGEYIRNPTNASEKVAAYEDVTYRITYNAQPAVGFPRNIYLGEAATGHLREGQNVIIAFADLDGNGAYTAGEPYGFVKDVDISWRGTSATIELSDTSPVFARVDLTKGVADRQKLFAETQDMEASGGSTLAQAVKTRVRVYRCGENSQVDGVVNYFDSQLSGIRSQYVKCVYDRLLDLSVRPYLTEADLMLYPGNEYDLDWANKGTLGSFIDNSKLGVRSISYRIYFGDDSESTILAGSSTNYFPWTILRTFDGRNSDQTSCRQIPTVVSPASVDAKVYSASPTFKWHMYNGEVEHNTYTAFRIVVDGVYDSGLQLTPPHDTDGNYTWTAPLYAGDIAPGQTAVFKPGKSYKWRVSMYNSMWPTDAWSKDGAFFLGTQTNGLATGNAKVAVKYFGPACSYAGKRIRVRAYTSPDFSGPAIAGGYVASPDDAETGLSVTGRKVKANCQLIGIPAGSYYLQAFIDMNDNGICEPWESSGYYCVRDGESADYLNPVAMEFGTTMGEGDLATIYIEDADTDGDGLPDAWEIAKYGSLDAKGVEELKFTSAGEFAVSTNLTSTLELQSGSTAPTAGIAGRLLASVRNAGTMALALGVNLQGYTSFSAAIYGSVSDELAEDGVYIRDLSFENGKIRIVVDAETRTQGSNSPLAYAVVGADGLKVKCTVGYATSLYGVWVWKRVSDITVGVGEVEIDATHVIPASIIDSCFIKVKLEK